jgi:hypothetical protein
MTDERLIAPSSSFRVPRFAFRVAVHPLLQDFRQPVCEGGARHDEIEASLFGLLHQGRLNVREKAEQLDGAQLFVRLYNLREPERVKLLRVQVNDDERGFGFSRRYDESVRVTAKADFGAEVFGGRAYLRCEEHIVNRRDDGFLQRLNLALILFAPQRENCFAMTARFASR